MTMDINNRKAEIKADVFLTTTKSEDTTTELPVVKTTKRSFDVAFLMLPDEKLKERENNKLTKFHYVEEATRYHHQKSPPPSDVDDDDDEEIEVDSPKIDVVKLHHSQKYLLTQKQQIFDDPQLGKSAKIPSNAEQKSAFTKVSLKEARLSPNLSISPDLSYQNSLSPSPPIRNHYHNFLSSPNQLFKTAQNGGVSSAYQSNFIPDNFVQQQENPFILKSPNPELLPPNFSKMRPIYRPDLPYNYTQPFPAPQEMLKMAQQQAQPELNIRNPAAAILTSLLPPSLAALSLPAQNVCAKCNISFRMTSDLVYHMRSHHKNDTTDYNKRKREEKLKCPVCAESFRERHHLTRHMTAHQDKDNDEVDLESKKKTNYVTFNK